MKKLLAFLLLVASSVTFVYSQAPKSFKYQAVIRNTAGLVMANANVSFQINIIQDSAKGSTVYVETQAGMKTNAYGLINLDIGKGTPILGSFNSLNWGIHSYYIGINMDPIGGTNYISMGIYELMSVPYALYAASSGSSSTLNLTGTGSTTVTGSYPNYTINGKYQTLKGSNDTIYLSNGGYVKLPYTAGTGIGLTGTNIINTLPNATHTGDALGAGVLTVVALQGRTISTTAPASGQVLSWNGSSWIPTANAGQAYNAGAGLALTGNTFSHAAHTGDAVGITNLTVVALQGRKISTTAPASNQVLSWNGSSWAPAANAGQAYYAGAGLTIVGNTFINTSPNASHTGDAMGTGALTVVAIQGNAISTTTPSTNQVLSWNGSSWAPAANAGQAYYAGPGLTVSGNTFSHAPHTGDAIGITNLTVVALQGRQVSNTAPASNQVLSWNGGAWAPAANAGQAYYAGAGLSITGNTFINTSPNVSHTGDALGSGVLTVVAIQSNAVSTTAPASGQVLSWNGSSWAPAANAGQAYYAGLGLSLSGNTFSHASHTGDATGITSLTVVALQGRQVANTTPATNQVLSWNGSSWTPSAVSSNTYYAGLGLSLSGNTFSHASHTGDATGITSLTVVALQGRQVANTAPAANQVLSWNGSSWTPSAVSSNTYYAGLGLSLSGNTFSHASHTGDATGITSLTVVALQGRQVANTAPAANQVLSWNGSSWTPSAVSSNTYYAGLGLSLSGNTFSHASHTGDATGITSLTVVALQGRQVANTTPATNQVLSWNGSSWTPSAVSSNTYYAGLGLSLSGNTFSHASHTGDATGITSLTVVALQGRQVANTAPAANQVLSWNGSSWTPSAVSSNTYYAGLGLSLSGNTFSHASHTGDATGITSLTVVALQGRQVANTAPAANQVLSWNGSSWTPSAVTSNTYYAGAGLALTGNTFSNSGVTSASAGSGISVSSGTGSVTFTNTSPNFTHSGDAIGSGALIVVGLQGRTISTTAPASGQVLSWNGSSWDPETLSSGTYYAGTGLTLTGSTFSHSSHSGDAIGQTSLTVVAIQGNAISTTPPATNQVLSWNGSSWTPLAVTSNTYYAGLGLSLSGNTFSHASHTGDATGITSLTVVALQGRQVANTAPAANQVLSWNGSSWTPSAVTSNTYYAGAGLALTGNTFSNSGVTSASAGSGISVSSGTGSVTFTNTSPNFTHSGDAIGSGALIVVGLQGRTISTTAPASGQVLSWNGSSWDPETLSSGTYYAGTGLTLTGSTFSHSSHSGDAIGQTSLTVVAIQGNAISTTPPATNQVLSWNGSAWTPTTGGTGGVGGLGVANQVTFWSNSSTVTSDPNLYWDNSNKRLGIGTTAPNQQLTITGNFNLPNSTSSSGVEYKGANTFIHNYGTDNTFVGISSGNLSMAGTDNTGVGYHALINNTSGSTNTALGSYALNSNTTGAGNIALGYSSLYTNSGSYNFAAGYDAMYTNSGSYNFAAGQYAMYTNSGSFNFAAGYLAMEYNGSGGNNIGIGTYALSGNTSGSDNIALGNQSSVSSTTGSENIALGTNSLYNNSKGNYNIALGYEAMYNNQPTVAFAYQYNVGIGYYSLLNNSNGQNNVGIGTSSLATNTTGSNNVAIGSGADILTGTISNSTAIGHTAIANASNQIVLGNSAISSVVSLGVYNNSTASPANVYVDNTGQLMRSTTVNSGIYYAGTGLTLSGATFSHNSHTGDALGASAITVVALQGHAVSANNPTSGQFLSWNGSNWIPTSIGNNVTGAGTSGQLAYWSPGNVLLGNSNLYFDSINHRLGIGTSSPVQQLDITQNFRMGNSITASGTTSGVEYKGANTFIHNFGTNNTFMGVGAGNLTLSTTDNTGIGYQALNALTSITGNYGYNVAVGSQALCLNTTGYYNTGTGYRALYNNSSGTANTALGFYALYQNGTTSYNTAVGSYALFSNGGTNSIGNTAVGYYSLEANQTGYYNTATGLYSLDANQTGYGNTAVGYNTLVTNTQGNYNTALGYNANVSSNSLSNSTAIGNGAITTANNQVVLGNTSVNSLFCMGATVSLSSGASLGVSATGQIGVYASSERYKENITNIAINTDKIYDLRPVSYTSKIDHQEYFGLIAEEVEKIFPDLVDYTKSRFVIPGSTSEELIPNGVKYNMLGVLMLNELKKHETRLNDLDKLKLKVENLENENQSLKEQLKKTQEQVDQILQIVKKKKFKKQTLSQKHKDI